MILYSVLDIMVKYAVMFLNCSLWDNHHVSILQDNDDGDDDVTYA